MTLETTGDAGAWLVGYQPLPAVAKSVGVHYRMDFEPSGTGPFFVWLPSLTEMTDEGAEISRGTPVSRYGLFPGKDLCGDYEHEARWGSSTGGTGYEGIWYAVAAADPWSLSLSIDISSGDDDESVEIDPLHVIQGDNATFILGGTHLGGMQTPVAGQVTLDTATPEGWVHLQALYGRLEPDGARQSEFLFPDGQGITELGRRDGAYTPVTGGTSSGGGWIDLAGVIASPSGDAHAEILYAETNLGIELGTAILPLQADRLPRGMSTAMYTEHLWPFPTEFPETCSIPG